MKKYLLIIPFILSIVALSFGTNYGPGDFLNVYAQSGLKMRMAPDINAESIIVIPYGDEVVVLNTFQFSEEKSDRIGWIDGHWILVEYFGLEGYIFDGFLSELPIPIHEGELCGDCDHLIYPFDQYLDDYFLLNATCTTESASELANHVIHELDSVMIRERSYASNWFHLEVTIQDIRIGEILNLFRSMIIDKQMRDEFEQNLIFHTGRDGKVNSILINMYTNPIKIDSIGQGIVRVSSTIIHTTAIGTEP